MVCADTNSNRVTLDENVHAAIYSKRRNTMNRFAQRFHLTCAIVAAFACVLYSAIAILAVFVWHTAPRELFMVAPVLVLAAGAAMEFKFYTDECKRQAPSALSSR